MDVLPNVNLAGDYIGDETGAIFAEQRDFTVRAVNGGVDMVSCLVEISDDAALLIWRGIRRRHLLEVFAIQPVTIPDDASRVLVDLSHVHIGAALGTLLNCWNNL